MAFADDLTIMAKTTNQLKRIARKKEHKAKRF